MARVADGGCFVVTLHALAFVSNQNSVKNFITSCTRKAVALFSTREAGWMAFYSHLEVYVRKK